jgi:hypothetical protein
MEIPRGFVRVIAVPPGHGAFHWSVQIGQFRLATGEDPGVCRTAGRVSR